MLMTQESRSIVKPILPSISSLLKDSWEIFKKSLRPLLILTGFAWLSYIVLGILLIISGFAFGLSQIVQNSEGIKGLANLSPPTILILILIAVLILLAFILVSLILNSASILIVNAEGKFEVKEAIKNSKSFLVPLIVAGVISSFLSFGALIFLIVPSLLISYYFSFVQYEIILNNKSPREALKRSYLLVSKNFGGIFTRFLTIGLIYLLISLLISSLFPGDEVHLGESLMTFTVNMFLGFYITAYSVTLYKAISHGLEKEPGKNITWMWIVALLGYVTIILSLSFVVKFIFSNDVPYKPANISPPITSTPVFPTVTMDSSI